MNSLVTYNKSYAGMVELVDTSHLGCDVERRVGSSPSTRTIKLERCGIMPPRKREPKKLTDRELINLYFDNKVAMTNIHNVMGCNESWYDKYYAITHTFKREDIDAMDDKQLENLLKLAETIQEALY